LIPVSVTADNRNNRNTTPCGIRLLAGTVSDNLWRLTWKRSGSGKTQLHNRNGGAYGLPTVYVLWSRAQHHVTTSLIKLVVGERIVATNLGRPIIFRLCWRILL